MPESKVKKELLNGQNISIIPLVDSLIEEAHYLRASDLHIDPAEGEVRVRMRIDGVLCDMHSLPKEIHSQVITRIKVLAGLRLDEHQAPQDGRFRLVLNDTTIDIRVSVAPTYHGENAVMRILAERAENLTLENLGIRQNDRIKIEKAARNPYGMILATGPTGSGKTTTLYTILKKLHTKEVSIITIEDPVEYSIDGINQMQVNARAGLTFANGLRSMLRQDPDIIMVGEVRDSETAGLAVNTALTGHLVLSTLHTNDAATTLARLIDLGLEPYLITATVNLVIGQRLVRKICSDCKKKRKITPAEAEGLKEIKQFPRELVSGSEVWRGEGCDECAGSGYKGRIGIYEIMEINEDIRNAMLTRRPSSEIKKMAQASGMKTMVEDGFQKAASGITTIEEVLRVIHE